MDKDGKQFGLIKPKKVLSAPKVGNIFGDDNDSETEDGADWVKKALKAEGEKARMKKQTKLNIAKALSEDPTIYQYDEIYEDLEASKAESTSTEKKILKPKYIHNLMKNAERRKREQEHRIERMVQKEREAEGEMYADKESFVTSAYRAKLEEFKKMEEEEERMDRLEAIGDVTKQEDLSGFYRHMFSQSVDGHKETTGEASTSKADEPNVHQAQEMSSDSGSTSDKEESSKFPNKAKTTRQYRHRVVQDSASESEADSDGEAQADLNKVAAEKQEHEVESPMKKQKLSHGAQELEKCNEAPIDNEGSPEVSAVSLQTSAVAEEDSEKEKNIEETNPIEPKVAPATKKISIWEKRTVGPVFEAALQRYYTRKAARLAVN